MNMKPLLVLYGVWGTLSLQAQVSDAPLTPYQNRWGRALPVVAVIGQNQYTETTDYIVPYAVLKQSETAEVVGVSMLPGPIELFPALRIQADMTADAFDSRYPEGADYVVVPAVHDSDEPGLLRWIQGQSQKGAVIVGVCDGVITVAAAGLLNNKQATGHWYALDNLEKRYPSTTWVRSRRYVEDRGVITTTGVTASIPVSLALVEALGGRNRALATAQALGVGDWSARHDSQGFIARGMDYLTIAGNTLSFWRHETRTVAVAPGVDELALALTADAYSRTWLSRVLAVASQPGPLTTRRGITLIADQPPSTGRPVTDWEHRGTGALTGALQGIEHDYGAATASLVASQVEYDPWFDAGLSPASLPAD